MSTLSQTDRLNLAVTRAYARRRGIDRDGAFLNALGDDPDPTDLFLYLTYLASAWGILAWGFGLLSVGAAFLEHKLDGSAGMRSFGVVSFLTVACLAGTHDAGFRSTYANGASREGVEPAEAIRLAHKARAANDTGILIQVVCGLLATAIIWYFA